MVLPRNPICPPEPDVSRVDFDKSGPRSGPNYRSSGLFLLDFIEIWGEFWCPGEDSNLHILAKPAPEAGASTNSATWAGVVKAAPKHSGSGCQRVE